ncbi:MAG: T9SS type A sorting domain-containing protein [Saprospiraceae bacterium]|nr:T9SS type A sorting domain-containing protein [Saprospiraceae bacterium]
MELYTITGQKVMQGQLKDQMSSIYHYQVQGLYFISINKDGLKFKSQKIVIQNDAKHENI